MAENLNSYGGVVGAVAVTAVSPMPPPTGTFVHAQDAGMLGQVKMTPVSNVVFQNSSNVMVGGGGGETPFYTSNTTDSSMCDSAGLTPQVDTISVTTAQSQSSGVFSVDGMMNTGAPAAATLPVTSNVKKTSFQITSVTVDSSASNDGGDDSADDLDESHTEDSSDVATGNAVTNVIIHGLIYNFEVNCWKRNMEYLYEKSIAQALCSLDSLESILGLV